MSNYTVLDLFAGCGGFSVGFEGEGFHSTAHIEIDDWACDTLRANFPESHVIQTDIRKISEADVGSFGPVDVIIGGPPCQGFSVAGPTQFGVEDPRNDLALTFLQWVSRLSPKVAIIENVPNILTKRRADGLTVADVARRTLEPLGYTLTTFVLNSGDFGVPQLRRRAFVVAVARGLQFKEPQQTHGPRAGGDLFTKVGAYVTVGEALSDLPPLQPGEGCDDSVPYLREPENPYQGWIREGSAGVTNHVAMRHTARLVERFRQIKAGQSLKDVALEYGQKRKLSGEINDKPFKYNNYRLPLDGPSLAIPASFQSLFIHPVQDRNLTAREAARLMSFPDTFVFRGKRTTMSWEKSLSQYYQIGNAVCPAVAAALARSVRACLNEAGVTPSARPKVAPAQSVGAHPVGASPLPRPVARDVIRRFDAASQRVLGLLGLTADEAGRVTLDSIPVPAATLPAALLMATERECPVCRKDLEPLGVHGGTMPFLISKDDVETLLVNEKEHGLDYHLRALFDVTSQCGHVVGEALSRAGLATLVEVVNPRTGRKVRGMNVARCPPWVESLRPVLFEAIVDEGARRIRARNRRTG